jgi:hypothetical protein
MNVCPHTEITAIPDCKWKAKPHINGAFREVREEEACRFAVRVILVVKCGLVKM